MIRTREYLPMAAIRPLLAVLAAGAVAAGALGASAVTAATLSRTAEVIHYEDPSGDGCSRYSMCDQPTGEFLTTFLAVRGERNEVTIAVEDDGLSIRDAGALLTLSPDSGCILRDEHAAICPLDRGTDVRLFDGDDRAAVATDVVAMQRVDGGPGADVLSGRAPLFGGDGADRLTLVGGGGAEGGAGDDLLVGTAGDDSLAGGTGRDLLRGLAGEDILEGGTGLDRLFAGAGDDVLLSRDRRRDVVDGGRGQDIARADRHDTVRSATRRTDPAARPGFARGARLSARVR